jgi:hypothetical protein
MRWRWVFFFVPHDLLLCYSLGGYLQYLGFDSGSSPFFIRKRESEKKPPFQGSVRNDLRTKKRAEMAKKPRPPAGSGEGLTLTALLFYPKSSKIPFRKTANAAMPIYT